MTAVIARLLAWIRPWFGRPAVPPVLGHVVFVTDPYALAHVRNIHAALVTAIERKAPHLIVYREWNGRLGYYDYHHLPPPNDGAMAAWFQGDRTIAALGKGPISEHVLRHELGHDITDRIDHPSEIFSGSPPQLTV